MLSTIRRCCKDRPLTNGHNGSYQCMLNVVYTLKASMLFLYYRITSNLRQQSFVKICAGYTFCGYLASELVLFLNCRPFSSYWILPPPQEECATYLRYMVVQAVFNISSDLAILSIIVPMLLEMHMSIKDKLPLLFILSLGFFLVCWTQIAFLLSLEMSEY
jgi:hypothetical protein